ncbi:MAG: hypothetical protein U5L10_00965 [Candidatus Moranbacteria bacterium]|nr:hypothetical protein [Candidatus Moranbacteria bacterium]
MAKSILDVFEENERMVGRLYEIYADKFPQRKDLWLQLVREEDEHVKEVRRIKKISKERDFAESVFHRTVVHQVMEFVQECIEKAREEKMSYKEAVETALRIEQSVLEKKCFDLFATTNKTVKEILDKMEKETWEHLERLEKEYGRI